jgi:hypothetical protein
VPWLGVVVEKRDQYIESAEPLLPGKGATTELIVHGVGGAPPTELLGDFHPLRVSGDRHAGFYRPKDPPERGDLNPDDFPREAFAWGGLTSGDSSRALWFLLLPFALMNTSGWMHRPGGEHTPQRSPMKSLLRLLAALGTVMLVVMFAHLSLDIVGYQCAWLQEPCRDTHWWLSWLNGSVFADYPGRVLAVASVVPLAGLSLIWWAGRFSFARFEEYVAGTSPPPEPGSEPSLGDQDFWRGVHPVRRLRRLHFQLGLATIAATLALTVAQLDRDPWTPIEKGAVWGAVTLVAVLLSLVAHPRSADASRSRLYDTYLGRLAWIAAWGVAAVAVWGAAWSAPALPRTDATPRLDGLISVETMLTTSQAVLGIVLLVWLLAKPYGTSFLGLGPLIPQVLAWFMIISVWSGAGIRLADWFGDGTADLSRFWFTQATHCTGQAGSQICYPLWFEDAAVAFAGVLVVGAALAFALLRRRADRQDIDLVKSDSGRAANWTTRDEERARRIARMHRHSRLVTRADGLLTVLILVGLIAFVWVGVIQADGWRFWSWLVTGSGWLLAFVPFGVVLIVRLALRSPSARRGIGVVFDVLTFFPVRVHPFSPPCYGERAVPQLAWRVQWLTDPGGGVVIRAHSQGTVLAATALLTGSYATGRAVLITYGSPIEMLYARHFPAYFGDVVPRLADRLGDGAWVHMYARTDPLGCTLRSAPPTVIQDRVKDPDRWLPTPGDPPPPALGHSTYHRHPTAEAWTEHLMRTLAGQASSAPTPDMSQDGCR